MPITLNTQEIINHYESFLGSYYSQQGNWTAAVHESRLREMARQYAKDNAVEFNYLYCVVEDVGYNQTYFTNYYARLQNVELYFNGEYTDKLIVKDVETVRMPIGFLGSMVECVSVYLTPISANWTGYLSIRASYDKGKDRQFALSLNKGDVVTVKSSSKKTTIERSYYSWEREDTRINMTAPTIIKE